MVIKPSEKRPVFMLIIQIAEKDHYNRHRSLNHRIIQSEWEVVLLKESQQAEETMKAVPVTKAARRHTCNI